MRSVFYLLVLFFLFSCTDPVSEDTLPTTGSGSVAFCQTGKCVGMVMSDNLELTIKITNFETAVAILSFELIFDPEELNISTTSGGEFGEIDFQSLEVSDTTVTSFSFFGNIVGDGDLMKVNFQGSGYDGTKVRIINCIMIDANGNEIEEDLLIQHICYIDEGLLISYAEQLPGTLAESWVPTGNYVWSNKFCSY